jgi:hypothetical protein
MSIAKRLKMRRQVSRVTVRRFDAHLYVSQQLIACEFEMFRGFCCRTDAGERESGRGAFSTYPEWSREPRAGSYPIQAVWRLSTTLRLAASTFSSLKYMEYFFDTISSSYPSLRNFFEALSELLPHYGFQYCYSRKWAVFAANDGAHSDRSHRLSASNIIPRNICLRNVYVL